MTRVSGLLTVLSLLLVAAGCGINSKNPIFNSADIPARSFLVGKGFSLDYSAPSAGTAYVVDMSSGKYLMTKSLEKGERIEFDLDPSQEEVKSGLESLGLDMSQLDISLFFVPIEDAAPEAD